jgi:hypothetical protein
MAFWEVEKEWWHFSDMEFSHVVDEESDPGSHPSQESLAILWFGLFLSSCNDDTINWRDRPRTVDINNYHRTGNGINLTERIDRLGGGSNEEGQRPTWSQCQNQQTMKKYN